MWQQILAHSLAEAGWRHQILEEDKDWMRQDKIKRKDIEICRGAKPINNNNNLVRISNISKQVHKGFTSSTRCRCPLETLRTNTSGCF